MFELLGVSPGLLYSQLLLGLINGGFYALLSLGLAIIFGLLNISNFAHGAFFMLGAFSALLLSNWLGLGYWGALLVSPLLVGSFGMLVERFLLRRIYKLDRFYGILLTFGLALIIEGMFREWFGATGQPYPIPDLLTGGVDLGFMYLPIYRGWVIVASLAVCVATWFLIEKTRLGAYLRAATENPGLVGAFGVNVPLMVMLTYGGGVALAAFAGVMAAPIYQVNPLMGSNLIIVVFAVVVIGGMGSITGAIWTGFALGIIEGLTKAFYPPLSSTVVFIVMALVLVVTPSGLFGGRAAPHSVGGFASAPPRDPISRRPFLVGLGLIIMLSVAPMLFYTGFLMKALCLALLAVSFNILAGYLGLISFGHAAFFGSAAYITAYVMKSWGLTPELGILAGTIVSTILGLVIGWIAIRSSGIYFAMSTLALAQMVYFTALQAPFTGGEDGIQSVPRGKLFGLVDLADTRVLYVVVAAIFLIGLFAAWRAIHSPFGQILKAIRENEPRAISLGYKTDLYKLSAFVLSAMIAGMAGSTKSLVFQLASLTDVYWLTSGQVVLMAMLGGMGTLLGPVVGAFVLVAIDSYLGQLGSFVTILQGAIFVLCVLTMRRGLFGELEAWFHRPGLMKKRLAGTRDNQAELIAKPQKTAS